ncbi:MAG TPA: hypothetical protein VHV26_06400 [Rhizomicrobium sp.]|nr:hypothetical protein [Rhizomicrobium sp.]
MNRTLPKLVALVLTLVVEALVLSGMGASARDGETVIGRHGGWAQATDGLLSDQAD